MKNLNASLFLRFFGVFSTLFILTLPYPFYFLPDTGGFIQPLTEFAVKFSAEHLFHPKPGYVSAILSDSTGMYIHTFNLFVFSVLLTPVLAFFVKNDQKLTYWLRVFLSYYLSLQLFRYGFDKVFKSQFYLPEPNTLYTPLGYLSKDLLYWSTMGSSRLYSIFTGILELIPAVLLLFRTSRKAAALFAFPVLLHVLVINLSFDISVKLFSAFLLLVSGWLAYPAAKKLMVLFKPGTSFTENDWLPNYSDRKSLWLYAVLKPLLIAFILIETLLVYVQTGNFNDDTAPRPYLHGAYETITDTAAWDSSGSGIKRIFIHRRGYLVLQFANDSMADYHLAYDTHRNELELEDSGFLKSRLKYLFDEKKQVLTLEGRLGDVRIFIAARKLDTEDLPLMKYGFHFTSDPFK